MFFRIWEHWTAPTYCNKTILFTRQWDLEYRFEDPSSFQYDSEIQMWSSCIQFTRGSVFLVDIDKFDTLGIGLCSRMEIAEYVLVVFCAATLFMKLLFIPCIRVYFGWSIIEFVAPKGPTSVSKLDYSNGTFELTWHPPRPMPSNPVSYTVYRCRGKGSQCIVSSRFILCFTIIPTSWLDSVPQDWKECFATLNYSWVTHSG